MPLTKQQLLIPRVLCIGGKEGEPNDTSNFWVTGQIIEFGINMPHVWFNGIKFTFEDFIKYPHLFKPLPWWEKRAVDEMPEYLKDENGEVWKVSEYSQSGSNHVELIKNFHDYERPTGDHDLYELQPADESEYQEYQKQKQ